MFGEKLNMSFEDLDDLYEEVHKIWKTKISEGFIKSLSESLPRRMEAVIDAYGDYTNY